MNVRPPYETASVPMIVAATPTVYTAINGIPARASNEVVRTSVNTATETSTNAVPRAVSSTFSLLCIDSSRSTPKHFYSITK